MTKKERNNEENGSDKSDDNSLTSSQVVSAVSEDWVSNYPSVINENFCPSVNCSIALTTPNGAPDNTPCPTGMRRRGAIQQMWCYKQDFSKDVLDYKVDML